jgi:hypothetical protein
MERAQTRPRSGVQAGLKVLTLLFGLFNVAVGLWSFFWPENFHDLAGFDPYNLHFVHDAGAFQLGMGASLLAALWWSDGLFVALAGATVGNVFHAWSHILDADWGGRSSDPWTGGLLVLVFVVMLAWRFPARGRA